MAEKKKTAKDVEKMMAGKRRRFVRLAQGAELYSMGLSSFRNIAREANATYRIRKIVLVDLDQIDAYLETFREFND